MDLLQLAVPFFVAAMLFEILYGWLRGRQTYRVNDSISSLLLGILSQARRFVTLGVGVYVYAIVVEHFSLSQLPSDHWLTWLVATILYDFCYYWLHRMGHERTILWAAHVAHHQSEDYNLSTALRQTSTGFLLGWVFYLPLFIIGIPPEVVITTGALNLIYQFWVHTEHVPKLGFLEWIFVTPSNHRAHHAQNTVYMDKNYGGIFILWDRWFGTFQEELDEEPCVYGIRGPLQSWNPWKALTHVYVGLIHDIKHAARWQDKFALLFSRTGWRPAAVERKYPRPKPALEQFQKYDPPTSKGIKAYALWQLAVFVVSLNLAQSSQLSYAEGLMFWLQLLLAAIACAELLQVDKHSVKAYALRSWELVRLLLLVMSVFLFAGNFSGVPAALSPAILAALCVYSLISVIWLFIILRYRPVDVGNSDKAAVIKR